MSMTSYKIGDTIFICKPLVNCLNDNKKGVKCDHCFATLRAKTKHDCHRCLRMHYCSLECQLEDHTIHELECQMIGKYYNPYLKHRFYRLFLRLYLMVITDINVQTQYKLYNGTNRSLEDLMAHESEIESDPKRCELFEYIHQTVEYLCNEFGFQMNSDLLFRLFCQLSINYYSVICYSGTKEILVGAGLYIEASVLNHSCDPNAATVYFGSTLVLKAIKPIEANDEITISYLDLSLDRNRRQSALKKYFYFDCRCSRCETNESDFKYHRFADLKHQIINESMKETPDWSEVSKLCDHRLVYGQQIYNRFHPQLIPLLIDTLKVKLKNKCEDIWALDDFIDDLQQRIRLIFSSNHDIYKTLIRRIKNG